jgi:zinc D-Ala-D-Ala carboxypeptidase
MTYLSSNFTLDEATNSQTAARLGIDNDIPLDLVQNAKLAAYGMEQVRALLGGKPILVSSWYRCPALNAAVGSKPTSAHMTGMAIDFTCPTFGTVDDVVKAIMASDIQYQQVIREFGRWVHIAFNGAQRQALIIDSSGTRGYA